MRIALFYPKNFYASWYSLGGYVKTLQRMGHVVVDCWLPGNEVRALEEVSSRLPIIEQLNECDCIISAFHEYTQPWLAGIYGRESWDRLKVPVIARFDESFDRGDLGLPMRWEELKLWATHFSFPAHQDAKRFGGQFLPFGSDTTMFNLGGLLPFRKKYDLGFIGSMYPLRMNYVQKLAPLLPQELTFNCGVVMVQDISGVCEIESTELLARNYSQIRIFFCLPPMSHLLVAKVVDVMACGTFVMYPKLPGDARRNNEVFEHGKHTVYYEYGRMADNAKQIKYYLEHVDEREGIAAAGYKYVRQNFRLDQMLEKLLEPVASKNCADLVKAAD